LAVGRDRGVDGHHAGLDGGHIGDAHRGASRRGLDGEMAELLRVVRLRADEPENQLVVVFIETW
jgi:hypothetical protein